MNALKFIKSFYHFMVDKLLYKNGPNDCRNSSVIASQTIGSRELLYDKKKIIFPIPKTNQPSLDNFFSRYEVSEIPQVTITRIPFGSAYAGGVVLSPNGQSIVRDLSITFGTPLSDHFLRGKRIQRPLHLRGTALCVASTWTSSYYHWLFDELPRHLISKNETFESIICSIDTDLNRQALQMLGTNKKRIVYIDQPRRFLGNHYTADLLVTPSYISPGGNPSNLLIELLRNFVEPLIEKKYSSMEKIFITRRSARGRRLMNEQKILSKFEASGYALVKLEDLTWQQQINLFYYAKEIVSPHGAGLANLVFCSKSPIVIEIFNANYVHWCFWKLAHLVGAQYIPLAFPKQELIENNPAEHGQADIPITEANICEIANAAKI